MNCSRQLIEGYIDEELDLESNAEVQEHIAGCQDCSAAYAKLREQQAAIRSSAPYYNAPAGLQDSIRAALHKAAIDDAKADAGSGRSDSNWRLLAIAASVLLAVSLAWNIAHLRSPTPERTVLADNILDSHVRSLIGTHLLDVVSTDQHTVKPWFNGKLDFAPVVKDLAPEGFPLIGGRIEYLSGRSVATLVYQRRKHVINVFTWPSAPSDARASDFSRNGYNELEWTNASMTYWAVSDLGAGELRQFKELLEK
ncbi:MAG TPA: anti-sigma factor [Bryobacteraceae bacterium]|jgi:anti-sigma factor RsiW